MKYRPEIDGLRALAVVPVIFFHGGIEAFRGGFVGVDVFFVISGYLITSIILSEHEARRFSLADFYERRARRILPALFLVIAACIPFALFLLIPYDLKNFALSVQYVAFFVSNILFAEQTGYFHPSAELKPLLHTWSLAVEEQFYIVFPVLLLVGLRFFKKWIWLIVCVLAVASLVYAQHRIFRNHSATFYLLPTRIWELGLGTLCALYLRGQRSDYIYAGSTPSLAMQLAGFAGLAMLAVSVFAFHSEMPVPGLLSLIPTIGTVLIILAAAKRTWTGRLLGSAPFAGIGLISYGAYLWHQPIFAFYRHAFGHETAIPILLLLSALAFVLAYFSWRHVEQPFRQRSKISRRTVILFTLGCIVAACVFNFLVQRNGGFVNRYAAPDRELAMIDYDVLGRYVRKRFNDARLAAFSDAGKKKVLIIGDSFAQDIVNAVHESGMTADLQLSTFLISVRCGNLFLETDFSAHIREIDRPECRRHGWYKNEELKALIEQADAVWLVSSWTPWQAPLVGQSFANLEKIYGPKFVVFGRKFVGAVHINALLRTPASLRNSDYAKPLEKWHGDVNETISNSVRQDKFIDTLRLLCGSTARCPQFTKDGKLISHDGGHLTPSGARLLGDSLKRHPAVERLLRK